MRLSLLNIFDRIYVISLKKSEDRRAHIHRHFSDIGIDTYSFHDACDGSSTEVERLYSEGLVMQYPPCFRCGKLDCGRSDCNNTLIPAQVAVFATYLKLWEKIAVANECVLICEDDVIFNPWWRDVLQKLGEQIATGELRFTATEPALLRLGWALNDDHTSDTEFTINDTPKMSNPCHAITSAYARELLGEFQTIKHTADVFQHSITAVSKTYAHTVFPPIAHELSWSTGVLDSLIHPKDIRARYLISQGKTEEAKIYQNKVRHHSTVIAHKKT
jgi:GR25 family glycosyltransferase involved in LPS biosynthesis